jgi:peptidyl-prolyl cis-trans isomerase C
LLLGSTSAKRPSVIARRSTLRWLAPAAVAGLIALAPTHAPLAWADGGSAEVSSEVVARVGEATVTRGELERRIAETPRGLLATYGDSPEAIRRGFLERVLVRDLLFAAEARARKLDTQKDVRDRVLGAQRALLIDELRKSERAAEISDDEVRAYYQQNASKFVSPKRIGLARILVATEAEARALIGELGAEPDAKRWADLARDKSLDKSTHLRAGALGLVAADGTTSRGDARVEPGLFAAAEPVDDGGLVPEPVREGTRFAVVWKRQTMRPVERPIELEAPSIRGLLAEQRIRGAVTSLLEKLRAELVREENPELCNVIAVSPEGDVERAKRPGVLPRDKRGARPAPTVGPGGLR